MSQNKQCCKDVRNVLIFACSGGANVGEISDRAARELMFEGCGAMFCLAGLGGGIPSMIQAAKQSDLNIVIDGCDVDCARKVFEKVGISSFRQVRITDIGIEKQKGVRCTDEQIKKVVVRAKELLTQP